MNVTVMSIAAMLTVERDPLLEEWLARPLDRFGRRCPGLLGQECQSYLRTRPPAVSRAVILAGLPRHKRNPSS
eukprot:13497927-Alexandrium_andersonii.AAC.1